MPKTVKIIWTAEEDEQIAAMVGRGRPHVEIAKILGRPRSTVGSRIREMKVRKAVVQKCECHLAADAQDKLAALDAVIVQMRAENISFAKISEITGLAPSTARDRMAKFGPPKKVAENRLPGRAKVQGRPPGPVPNNPGPAPSPNVPWWRRCLGESCGRVFWSLSAVNRICPRCKGSGNELVRGGTAEYRLIL